MSEEGNIRIDLQDHSDRDMSEQEAQGNPEDEQPKQTEGEEQEQQPEKKGTPFYQKPEAAGNAIGSKINDTMAPVSKGVETATKPLAKPIGGIVDPLVGATFRSAEGVGGLTGVGFGNKEGGPAKQQEAEAQKMKEPFGGKEQNADNPLGL